MVDKGLEIFIPYRKDCDYGKSIQERQSKRSSKERSSESSPGKSTKNLSSIDFSDKDFIVFSLQQDGAILRKPGKHEYGDCTNTNSGMPICRKLIYGANVTKQHSSYGRKLDVEHTSIDTRNKREFMTNNKKAKEKATKGVYEMEKAVTEPDKQKEVLGLESSDSYQSDASSSSFAFPVLSWEGHESPAKMPKPETLHFWKHKKWGVLCLCKRF